MVSYHEDVNKFEKQKKDFLGICGWIRKANSVLFILELKSKRGF